MKEEVMYRHDFSDIKISDVPYLKYEPYNEVPGCEDFVYGTEKSIVLRNIDTGKLERLDYVLCGAIPAIYRLGYQEYWGEIKVDDGITCYLAFCYDVNGNLEKIHASFAGKSPSDEEFQKANEKITYAAQISTMEPFGNNG